MDNYGNTVLRAHSSESAVVVPAYNISEGKIRCTFFNLPLMHGIYSIALWLGKPNQCFDYIEDVAKVYVEPADVYGTGILPSQTNSGICYTHHAWNFVYSDKE